MVSAPLAPKGRVLLVVPEFAQWQRSDAWLYAAGLGFEEGLEAQGFSCTVLPALSEYPSLSHRSWLYHAPRLLDGEHFDHAWVWITQTAYDPAWLEWLTGVAAVRVGVVTHSLEYTPAEYFSAPHLLARRGTVETQLRAMTHVLAMDEVDAAGCERRLGLPAMWLPSVTPRRTLRQPGAGPPGAPAIVVGPLDDDERAALLDRAELRSLIARPPFPETDIGWQERFDALQRDTIVSLVERPATVEALARYVSSLRLIRRSLYDLELDGLRRGSAAVNLPSRWQGYGSRVVPSMAAGVPVVSWDVPHRPAQRSIFAPGREIRLFARGDIETLAGHVRDLRADPAMAQAQAEAASHVIAQHHTTEHRVAQIIEWLGSGVDRLRHRDEKPASSTGSAARWGLPDTYRRREAPAGRSAANATTATTATTSERSDAYPLAGELATALGCARLIDLGCPEPSSLVRLATRLRTDTVALGAPDLVRSYSARCPAITWRVWNPAGGEGAAEPAADRPAGSAGGLAERRRQETANGPDERPADGPRERSADGSTEESADGPGKPSGERLGGAKPTLVLCALQFERAASPDVLAATLARLLGDRAAGLIVSVDRERTWGAADAGPPPPAAHLQEWSAIELAAMLRAAGLHVLHQTALPAAIGRRELTCVATVVVSNAMPDEQRTRVTTLASAVIDAYAQRRETASSYALFEASERVPPIFISTPVPNAPATPTLQALQADDKWVALHSTRAPLDEAARWAARLAPALGAPVVLIGLGLGYHALALADRTDAGRVVVLDPLPDVIARAREVAATRRALDDGRIDLAESWVAFKRLADATRVDLSDARLLTLPVYQRLADQDYATCSTLLTGAIAWTREGLEGRCKPFSHPEGMSVVISTCDRVGGATALVERIASQQPCGAPVEILLVNDNGTSDVFDAARAVARRTGCTLRAFDTHYTGYGLTLARNVGLRHARYATTVFLDDDLEVGLDLLRRYREAPEGVRMGRIDFVYEDAGRWRHCPDRRIALQGPDRALLPWAAFAGFMWGGNCAVSTELALALGGFDEAFLNEGEEDLDFSTRAVRATHRPVAVPSAIATHHGLDRNGRAWLGFERFTRSGRAGALLADPARGLVVNGGIGYWAGPRWDRFVVESA